MQLLIMWVLSLCRLAGQALPPGCNPDSVGEQLAELELSLDSNATWTGPLVRAEANDVDFAYFEFGNAR